MGVFSLDFYTQLGMLLNMFTDNYIITDKKTIKKRLIDMGLTQSQIAKELGVGRSSISLVISNKSKSKRIVQFLYELGVIELFPVNNDPSNGQPTQNVP